MDAFFALMTGAWAPVNQVLQSIVAWRQVHQVAYILIQGAAMYLMLLAHERHSVSRRRRQHWTR